MAIEKISAAKAKAGMVLAHPINDAQGRVIIAEGTRLTPVHIKRLGRWGVEELHIDTAPPEDENVVGKTEGAAAEAAAPTVKLDEAYMREVAAVFGIRFQATAGQPLMEHLKKIAFKRVVLAGRGGLPGVGK